MNVNTMINGTSPHPAVSGLRAGAVQEHRDLVHRLLLTLRLAGKDSASLSQALASTVWLLLAILTVTGLSAPPLRVVLSRTNVPDSLVGLALVGAAMVGVIAMRSHRVALMTRHHLLLGLPSRWCAVGLRLGLSLMSVPAPAIIASQCLRHGSVTTGLAAAAVALSGVGLLWPGTTTRSRRTLVEDALRWLPAILLVASVGVLVATSWDQLSGSLPFRVPSGAAAVIALVMIVGAVVATRAAAAWIGRSRLGPRQPAAHRSAGRLVLVVMTLTWFTALALHESSRFNALSEHAAIAGPLLLALFLRARHVRFTSVEALGHGLLLARDADAASRRISAWYRVNGAALIAPSVVSAAVLLFVLGSPSTVALLVALVVLEVSADEMIVHRTTTLLAASQLPRLTTRSRSGLAAVMCFGVVFTAAGAAGLFPVFSFAQHPAEVAAAALLLLVSAAVLQWLNYEDSPHWLATVRATNS